MCISNSIIIIKRRITMKRRTLAVVLAAAMTAGMLVGCTGGG
ncbi:hypothetical protein CLOSTASPAR_03307 [[Clostridium] asparagiforme DSM 15981]|uniref:Uncharacterized protein n=1 Tax=[Clostridium] asparagiforme DSM 15981 TaxID=518636 RepID=C0D218_9FIRM|nr:hypothetical protein CLOSTASPAR_03307 [[Clostridium] asparagiforme DSM 15981]